MWAFIFFVFATFAASYLDIFDLYTTQTEKGVNTRGPNIIRQIVGSITPISVLKRADDDGDESLDFGDVDDYDVDDDDTDYYITPHMGMYLPLVPTRDLEDTLGQHIDNLCDRHPRCDVERICENGEPITNLFGDTTIDGPDPMFCCVCPEDFDEFSHKYRYHDSYLDERFLEFPPEPFPFGRIDEDDDDDDGDDDDGDDAEDDDDDFRFDSLDFGVDDDDADDDFGFDFLDFRVDDDDADDADEDDDDDDDDADDEDDDDDDDHDDDFCATVVEHADCPFVAQSRLVRDDISGKMIPIYCTWETNKKLCPFVCGTCSAQPPDDDESLDFGADDDDDDDTDGDDDDTDGDDDDTDDSDSSPPIAMPPPPPPNWGTITPSK